MLFKQIRKKSKVAREQYAFWYAAGITGLIAIVWVVSLQYRFDDSFSGEEIAASEHKGAFAQFWTEAKSNFAAAFSAVGTTPDDGTPSVESENVGEGEAAASTSSNSNVRAPFTLTPRATSTSEQSEEKPDSGRPVLIETRSEQDASATTSVQ